jgi:hypothetical protein
VLRLSRLAPGAARQITGNTESTRERDGEKLVKIAHVRGKGPRPLERLPNLREVRVLALKCGCRCRMNPVNYRAVAIQRIRLSGAATSVRLSAADRRLSAGDAFVIAYFYMSLDRYIYMSLDISKSNLSIYLNFYKNML